MFVRVKEASPLRAVGGSCGRQHGQPWEADTPASVGGGAMHGPQAGGITRLNVTRPTRTGVRRERGSV